MFEQQRWMHDCLFGQRASRCHEILPAQTEERLSIPARNVSGFIRFAVGFDFAHMCLVGIASGDQKQQFEFSAHPFAHLSAA